MHQTTSAVIFNNFVNYKIYVKRPTVAQIPIFITQMHLKDTANISVIRKSKRKKKKKKNTSYKIFTENWICTACSVMPFLFHKEK